MTQDEALAIMENGNSVLLTGAAGTGKTFVLNKFIKRSRRRGLSVAVTATTGLAATHLGGNTIHAWSGIGVHDELPRRFGEHLSKSRLDLIRKADVLIIDEISMLHDFRLDLVDEVLRIARDSPEPFGGLQVILCGDFFQLPPINRGDSRGGGFVTNSLVWQSRMFTVCYLEKQYRQSADEAYAQLLNGVRSGVLMKSQLAMLQSRIGLSADPFEPRTRLLTVNVDVDAINAQQLNNLQQEPVEYRMYTTGGARYVEQLKRSCLAQEVLVLKRGAAVMCIKNSQDRKYVNGSLGEVVDFEPLTGNPVVKLISGAEVVIRPDTWELRDGDKKRASITQLPLRLAWAMTVHKSQGMTLDSAQIDLSKAFVEGMGYVALSRVKSLDSLILDGMNGMALRTSREAREIDDLLRAASEEAVATYAAVVSAWHQAEQARPAGPEPVTKNKTDVVIEYDEALFDKLRQWRAGVASEQGMPAYIIAHDKTLQLVAARKPLSLEELERVPGFGPKKLAEYGDAIVGICNTPV